MPFNKYSFTVSCIILLAFTSCKNATEENVKYSFFVAGHAYGNPMNYQYGFHPPFVKSIPFFNNYPKMSLGVLTGDIIAKPTKEYWEAALVDIHKFSFPVYLAAGNHDRGKGYLNNYTDYYYHLKKEDDLFIILSPTNWNIEKEQKNYLIKTIQDNHHEVNNIFIFCHELIWWAPDNKFGSIEINYRPHYPGSTNYWGEINPLLDSIPNKVVIFAGDVGCGEKIAPYMYYNEDNITFIATGMGGGKKDNVVIVEVDKKNRVNYKLIGLNNSPISEMESLEDYVLPMK